jgi:hypothetical protein
MQTETEIALANLDWLIHHDGMRLEYGARAVLNADGEPAYVLDDLAVPGLTAATRHMVGRLPIAICYTAITSSPDALLDSVLNDPALAALASTDDSDGVL